MVNGDGQADDSLASVFVNSPGLLGRPFFLAFKPSPDPVVLILELVDDVESLNVSQGIANSLNAKLDAVLQALEDANQNNDVAAINALEAFINAVQAQSGNQIPEPDAEALIAKAQLTIDALLAE